VNTICIENWQKFWVVVIQACGDRHLSRYVYTKDEAETQARKLEAALKIEFIGEVPWDETVQPIEDQ
jgi:hypothetical protein